MPRAALYSRVSSDEQPSGLATQEALCLSQAQGLGYTVESFHAFKDEGFSGSTLDRPSLSNLLIAIIHKSIDAVFVSAFVSALDRLTRESRHLGYIMGQLREHGVALYVNGSPVQDTAEDELQYGILAQVAQFERKPKHMLEVPPSCVSTSAPSVVITALHR
jgi:site-specific DNA recombinase